ncbi:hypothetical protein DCS_07265 [Drechmeria coniospora]|uniref:Uncharacterized protein n=1 Tax=Drechmeria coniospora TaxID=98403 RepID=A0A151GDY5_DRECN|nr:hypothetical protein DCS_07265 [Drechmeria coniospora]KYK55302.1 hypothetical protein DCS_07265 [Drechmeria coniospora]
MANRGDDIVLVPSLAVPPACTGTSVEARPTLALTRLGRASDQAAGRDGATALPRFKRGKQEVRRGQTRSGEVGRRATGEAAAERGKKARKEMNTSQPSDGGGSDERPIHDP